jgi:hypothetical protein
MNVTTARVADGVQAELRRTFRSMATDVNLCVVALVTNATVALDSAEAIFTDVAASCTRFDLQSPLMRANAQPRRWNAVPPRLFAALEEAHEAHVATAGAFDPRVLRILQEWGYDRTLPFRSGDVSVAAGTPAGRRPGRRAWKPHFDPAAGAVRLGPDPIDLGGIGKGLAVSLGGRRSLRGRIGIPGRGGRRPLCRRCRTRERRLASGHRGPAQRR